MDLFERGAQLGRTQDICAAFSEIHAVPLPERNTALLPLLNGLSTTPTGRRMELALYHDLWGIVDLPALIDFLIDDYPDETLAFLSFDLTTLTEGIRMYSLWEEDVCFARTAANCALEEIEEVPQDLEGDVAKTIEQIFCQSLARSVEVLSERTDYWNNKGELELAVLHAAAQSHAYKLAQKYAH